jgi:RNA polymerase sigma-70 factor (ECF subfamily)
LAQEQIIRLYQKRIAGFIYTMICRPDEMEDIAQNIFIKMILHFPKLRNVEQFEPWLFKLARNTCMDFLRKEKLKRIFTRFLPEHDEIPEKEDFFSEQVDWLRKTLQELPPKQRELIILKQDKNYSYEELAKITGSTISSVKSKLFRAKQALLQRRENEFRERSMDAIAGEGRSVAET